MKRFNPADNGVHMPFNDDRFIEKWAEWLQYRKERRLPNYVPTGLKRTFNAIIRDSGNDPKIAVLMIEQAIEKSWMGIYPLKTTNNGTNNSGNIKEKPIPSGNVPAGGFGQL